MENLHQLLNFILHIDNYLLNFVSTYGTWTYLVLFLIIFCETGLVVTPFLPGDSLLFVAGSIAAQPATPLNIILLLLLLIGASILGNQLNYFIGRVIGPRVFSAESSWLFNKKHLIETHQFYEKHGGKTIILARFIPIIRTFAPFVAGIGYMGIYSFSLYNITSALLWIGSLLGFGYFLGSLPFIKDNFSLVIYGIVILSISPPLFAFAYRKMTPNGRHKLENEID
ncbi:MULTISPECIES: DedA family protein [Legionella]|uniref:DedA family protein n=1 Tax=Legionella maceachernii TaxID=466 RepID=A0A0W0W131_9GAMM|nr:DedA family protein [Legionella maceachernii]KTD25955.1 DedA family protein [Legionella maceachernii]SJZ49304.1 membrane-associated protein [Legionella maceachernii]SUP03800.1 SNARE associated Golgi protein [Legionella maceachernii]